MLLNHPYQAACHGGKLFLHPEHMKATGTNMHICHKTKATMMNLKANLNLKTMHQVDFDP